MKTRDLTIPITEYGMTTGAPTPVAQQQSGSTAKANAATKTTGSPSTAPSKSALNKPSTSPSTDSNQPKETEPVIAKASELEKDFEFPDEQGNVVKVITPVDNDNKAVVVQNTKTKEFYTLSADDKIALPQLKQSDVATEDSSTDALASIKSHRHKLRTGRKGHRKVQLGSRIKKLSKLIQKHRQRADEYASSDQAEPVVQSESVYSRIAKLPLAEQLRVLSKFDTTHLDQVLLAEQSCSTLEGAVPDNSKTRIIQNILSKPLLGSDLRAQMEAYLAVPAPSMVKAFRQARAEGGDNVDLRSVFERFINSSLHPAEKEKAGISESVVSEATIATSSPASVPAYIKALNRLLASGGVLAVGGTGQYQFTPNPGQQVVALSDMIIGKGQDQNGKDVTQVQAKFLHKEPIKVASKQTHDDEEKVVFNRGELAEAFHALAAFVRFVSRPTRDITLDDVIKWIPRLENNKTLVVKVKDAENKEFADEFHIAISLKPSQWAAFKKPTLVLKDSKMLKILGNIVDDANQETGRRADKYAANGRYDLVKVIGDGVSGETETKTDVTFVNQVEQKHRGYSLKAGTASIVHQVGGGAVTGITPEQRFNILANDLFTVGGRAELADLSSVKNKYIKTASGGSVEDRIAAQRIAYIAATKSINNKLLNDDDEKSFIKVLAKALKYFQSRDDDNILLKHFTGTTKGTYILDSKRFNDLHKLGLDLIATYDQDDAVLPTIKIIDKNSGELLVKFRTMKQGTGYIRNIIEKGDLWNKITNVSVKQKKK
jgi:hypothetical protein